MRYGAAAPVSCLIVLLLLIGGCGSRAPATVSALAPTPIPDYGVGDSYQFSNGETDTVVAVDRDTVRWRGSDGTYVTSRDMLLPRLAWNGSAGQGQRQIAATGPLLFPLQPGKSVMFSATRTGGPQTGGTVREMWRCDIPGPARVATPAGTFETWKIDCSMTDQPGGAGSVMVQRSFYYAPEIGFYVRRDERVGGGPVQQVQLVNYTSSEPALPNSALRLRVAGIQRALEHEVSGGVASWRDPATGDAGEVLPTGTVRNERYGWCRNFAERMHAAGRVYHLEGTGCRNAAGIWDIVALAPAKNGKS